MRHCSPDELMDVLEGVRTETSLPHLSTCAECRQQLIEARAVLIEVRDVPVPEPSAQQLARLSARVRDAVASEVERSRAAWWRGDRWSVWAWGIPVAAVAVLTFALVGPALNRPAPAVSITQTAGSTATNRADVPPVEVPESAPRERDLDVGDDSSLGLMFDLAAVVDLDTDPAPVLAMGVDTVDEAVGDLSPDEQHELARLLKEAIERPGA